jgi:hypothetical protein
VSTTRRATRLISSGPATDVPPYFWTTKLTGARVPVTPTRLKSG